MAQRENTMQVRPVHEVYQIYRIREVSEITGLARSTIYSLIKDGKFPKPLKLSVRAVGWSSLSVFQWLAERDVAL
jgi:prophage regulatory protein